MVEVSFLVVAAAAVVEVVVEEEEEVVVEAHGVGICQTEVGSVEGVVLGEVSVVAEAVTMIMVQVEEAMEAAVIMVGLQVETATKAMVTTVAEIQARHGIEAALLLGEEAPGTMEVQKVHLATVDQAMVTKGDATNMKNSVPFCEDSNDLRERGILSNHNRG